VSGKPSEVRSRGSVIMSGKNRLRSATAGFSLLCIVLTAPALANFAHAHHSYHMYNLQETVTLEGRVIEFVFVYPHAHITLEVMGDGGTAAVWEIETVSPGRLERRGVTSSSLAAGDLVSIDAYPSRNGERRMAVRSSQSAFWVPICRLLKPPLGPRALPASGWERRATHRYRSWTFWRNGR
jgi:hypothetical protein